MVVMTLAQGNCQLSSMSGDQTSELKELERDYEAVLDENCPVFFSYFKEVLENKDRDRLINPPSVVFEKIGKVDKSDCSEDEKIKAEESGLKNGQYNVMTYFLCLLYLLVRIFSKFCASKLVSSNLVIVLKLSFLKNYMCNYKF